MKKNKSQTMRIIDAFVITVVLIISVTLVGSGISISRINTEYLETGVRTAKIVAERKGSQLLVMQNDAVLLSPKKDYAAVYDKILTFLPPPVNTVYLCVKEFKEAVVENQP